VNKQKKPIDKYIAQLQNDKYTYRLRWSEIDQEYVGRCLHFSRLIYLGQTPEEALEGIRGEVANLVANTPYPVLQKQLKEAAEVRRRVAVAKLKRIEAEIRKQIEAEAKEAEQKSLVEAAGAQRRRAEAKQLEAEQQKLKKAKKIIQDQQTKQIIEKSQQDLINNSFWGRLNMYISRLLNVKVR
jgi:hypothetical protein